MNVNELIEELDGYGGHLPVAVELPASAEVGTLQKPDDDVFCNSFAVDLRMVDGVQTLTITPAS